MPYSNPLFLTLFDLYWIPNANPKRRDAIKAAYKVTNKQLSAAVVAYLKHIDTTWLLEFCQEAEVSYTKWVSATDIAVTFNNANAATHWFEASFEYHTNAALRLQGCSVLDSIADRRAATPFHTFLFRQAYKDKPQHLNFLNLKLLSAPLEFTLPELKLKQQQDLDYARSILKPNLDTLQLLLSI